MTDSKMPIGQQTHVLRAELVALADEVNHHKIIARTMHFGEFQLHPACLAGVSPAHFGRHRSVRMISAIDSLSRTR